MPELRAEAGWTVTEERGRGEWSRDAEAQALLAQVSILAERFSSEELLPAVGAEGQAAEDR